MKREQIVDRDRAHIWRPYTSSEDQENLDPFVVARAEGSWLYDEDGRAYLDGNSSWWCKNLGHRHPRLVAVLREQSETLVHCSMAQTTHEHAAELALELASICPGDLSRVFYSDDGSTAVEVALKMAFQYWQQNGHPEKRRFVVLSDSFHGDTFGCMSASGVEAFHRHFAPLLFDVLRMPADQPDVLRKHFEEYEGEIAGVLVEPLVQGAGGMRFSSTETLAEIRRLCTEHEAFMIADEVFVGYGRAGSMWACEQAEVEPDILCTAKGFSGGMIPFAATVATEQVFEGFRGDKSRALMHGHTFFGNPLGAAIAREVLRIYDDEKILEGIAPRSEMMRETFKNLPGASEPRVLGMVAAAEFGDGGYLGKFGWEVSQHARELGLYLRPLGDTLYLCPPLNIPIEDLERMLERLAESVERATKTL